ncbi:MULTISPECIES: SMI1/KNR4 family protein [Streptomyces]|uniref:SMI1/KNR4 family protein n=1 Tax=Streptomyces dengpaensis TaxID=2049881 RepID=A0ABN5I591_9ACTN|nr:MULTISPECIES: SMI1/KNR4 family protein [Streptomyces]AVH58174.1 SMI1/KNR4 family protein [Streptomyces dengpaensis]PIB08139.1 SMI1/KNR4 family protein [Streptomyces sp. HG99]
MGDSVWVGVRERVQALGGVGAGDRVFGGLGHKFFLEDPLTAAQLADLEACMGVTLPEEYRGFLRHVGAGGAGPSYGVFPVRLVQGRWRWEGDGADLADLSRLAEPFPREGADPEAVRELLAEQPEEEDFEEIEDFDDAMEAWDERWETVMWSSDRTVGAIVISHIGCAARQWLVISGPERGRIWSDNRVDDEDLSPLLDEHGEPVTFAGWFLTWLHEAERQSASVSAGD